MLTFLYLAAATLALVHGHGYMSEPPNRASMWRFGYKTPANYDDSQYFCGGFQAQWETYKGVCGPCGDSLGDARPRSNENGGRYGTGLVTRTYKAGQDVTVTVQVTANHMGWFQFSVCKLNSATQLEENSCFTALQLSDGSGTQYKLPNTNTGPYTVRVKLPAGLTCSRCVLQWHYNTGNSWGVCPNGSGAMGCGKQENFRSCSDIAITA